MFREGGVRFCIRAGDTGDDFGKGNCVRNYVGLTRAAPSIMDRVSVLITTNFEGENNRGKNESRPLPPSLPLKKKLHEYRK